MEVKVRPIHADQDFEAALLEIDRLMDAVPGTRTGDRVDVLVTPAGAGPAAATVSWTSEKVRLTFTSRAER
jgi:hypothetical protein